MRRLVLTFLFLLCSLPALAQSTGPIAPSGTPNPITDASAIAGNAATKWNPAYWGNPGHGIVHRFNRILCGEAALASSDAPVSVPDWMETLFPGLVQNSQFICIDTIGSLSVVGAARTSDYRTAFGGVSQGSQGVTGIGVNDDTGAGAPIACGSCPFGIRNTGVGGVTLGSQMDVNNGGSLVDLEPSGGIVGGSTIAGLFTGGAYSTFATQKASADIVLEQGSSIPTRKGIVAMAHAFDTALGAGGSGLFAEIYRGQSIRWRNATPTTDSEIWADASGLHIASEIVVTGSAWTAFTLSPSCGSATFTVNSARYKQIGKTTFLEFSFTVNSIGTCTNNITVSLPNTANSTTYLVGREEAVAFTFGGCQIGNGPTTIGVCSMTGNGNFSNGSRFVGGGVYENQ